MKPKIGIVVCGLMDDRQFVTNTYIQSVTYSPGGLPFILPLVSGLTTQYRNILPFAMDFSFAAEMILRRFYLEKSPKTESERPILRWIYFKSG